MPRKHKWTKFHKLQINFSFCLFVCALTYIFFDIDIFELDPSQDYPYGQGFVTNIMFRFTRMESGYLLFSAVQLSLGFLGNY